MQYRKFGKLDWQGSALGFGCMRLPTTDGNPMSSNINEEEAIRMIRHAIDHGVNYVDTAYAYHGGKSEVVVGKALLDGYRAKVKLATKSPVWLIKQAEDFDKLLDEQLAKLQTNAIDFYLLHSMNRNSWPNIVQKLNLFERVNGALKDGRIKHIGFSFHDEFALFKQIVDGFDGWDFCQIQYNYLDTTYQAGTKGLKYAAAKGLAVVVMEPLRGGKLAMPPEPIREFFQKAAIQRQPYDWALQWVWNRPEVSVVLSGMTNMDHVNGNLAAAEVSGVGSLTSAEQAIIKKAQKEFESLNTIPCTRCNYCMPCPNGVDIPGNFEAFNDGAQYKSEERGRAGYKRMAFFGGQKALASSCQACNTCEDKCPQHIHISELMPIVHSVLGEGQPFPSKI
ncbi:MAG: aldo/keto reductase [Anaerolineaceae bacterium]|nr:aldo/keto reductase [Anaerolineaceae bacterium]